MPKNETPGLPEGLRIVRFGTPEDGEYVLTDNGSIAQLQSPGKKLWPVVAIEPGYTPMFDMSSGGYKVVRLFAKPPLITVKFKPETVQDRERLMGAVSKLPGFEGLEESEA